VGGQGHREAGPAQAAEDRVVVAEVGRAGVRRDSIRLIAQGWRAMRAVVQDTYGSADVLELRNVARPAPADGKVLVRVRAAGLDRGVWHVMTGLPYLVRFVVPTMGPRRPKVPIRGMDLAGRGGRPRRHPVPARRRRVRLDRNRLLRRVRERPLRPARAHAGQPALRAGGGRAHLRPISGLAALQGLRDVGEAELVRSIGADEVVDYTREDVTDGLRHWDLILDSAGHRSLSRLRRALSPAGTLVIVGSEGRGRSMGGFDRQLRAVALSRVVGHLLAGGGRGKIVITV
jgi:hypothetical protein